MKTGLKKFISLSDRLRESLYKRTMIVLNLVIGVIMNSMDESNAEMKIKQELLRRKTNPQPLRDGIYDLHLQMEKISEEMEVIKKLLEEKDLNKSL